LIQWSIESAKAAHVAEVIVSTDDDGAAGLASALKCLLHPRKAAHATDTAPDILWVLDVLPMVQTPYVAICRPTSPFRTASTIRRGYAALVASGADSIRAVTRVTHPHPAKMWIVSDDGLMSPVLAGNHPDGTPWHSSPTQSLPEVYAQNASLEIARVDMIRAMGTISGYRVRPLLTDPIEGMDLNTPADWAEAECVIEAGLGSWCSG